MAATQFLSLHIAEAQVTQSALKSHSQREAALTMPPKRVRAITRKPKATPKSKAKPTPKVEAKPAAIDWDGVAATVVYQAIIDGLNRSREGQDMFIGRMLPTGQEENRTYINLLKNGTWWCEVMGRMPSPNTVYEFVIAWNAAREDPQRDLAGIVVSKRRLCGVKEFWELACQMGLRRYEHLEVREMITKYIDPPETLGLEDEAAKY